ncbi:MAG: iron-sulfur cluster assembly accessory protein [Betaproteobacteria bacterium]|nr:iron-sulfur cluster assembly accessory protein [Betaproteobacteria bacterium]MDE2424211.1 iron-sulfur cluster assembly accessory protein [Betaproteobacteria bacterium]
MAITLTPAAVKHVTQALEKRGGGIGLRFGVKQSGCSGLAYILDYADEAGPEDISFTQDNNLVVLVKQADLPFVDGTELDYRKEGLNSVFKFNNPNVTDSCGCGESFTTRTQSA